MTFFVDDAGRWRDARGHFAREADVVRWLNRTTRRAPRPAPAPRVPPPPTIDVPLSPFAVEWEFGVEYAGTKGVGSRVDINLRVRRADSAPMPEREARRVMREFLARIAYTGDVSWHHTIPGGYRVAAINWRRTRGGWRPTHGSGGPADLRAFREILRVVTVDDFFRVGPVDDDDDSPSW